MVDLNGHEAGNGGHSQGKPTAYRDSSTRREAILRQQSTDVAASSITRAKLWELTSPWREFGGSNFAIPVGYGKSLLKP